MRLNVSIAALTFLRCPLRLKRALSRATTTPCSTWCSGRRITGRSMWSNSSRGAARIAMNFIRSWRAGLRRFRRIRVSSDSGGFRTSGVGGVGKGLLRLAGHGRCGSLGCVRYSRISIKIMCGCTMNRASRRGSASMASMWRNSLRRFARSVSLLRRARRSRRQSTTESRVSRRWRLTGSTR